MTGSGGTHSFALLRVRFVLAVALVAWAGAALADTYAILSLIGDRITIVTPGRQIGSHLDQNQYQVARLEDSGFDDFTVRTAHVAIMAVRPGATTVPLRARDPALYALRDAWLNSDSVDVRALIAQVAEQLPAEPDARLLLIAPYKGEIELKSDVGYRGRGKVGGLGFYLDSSTRMSRSDTFESSVGFLGVFANFQLLLIDMKGSVALAHERIVVGTTYPAALAPDRAAWNALTAEKKTDALESLIKGEIDRVVPVMLAPDRK